VRYLVDRYYQSQEDRKRAANQLRAASRDGEPNRFLVWATSETRILEENIRRALTINAPTSTPGQWCLSILGVGPVITAGLLAHIDIRMAPYPSNIWSFFGLNPNVIWEKGHKRPWNAAGKVLAWKIGDSFVKISNNANDTMYGKVYKERKVLEVDRNARGEFAATAAHTLETRNITDKPTLAIYQAGQLPPGRLDLRARRIAVKLFLAHLHHVLFAVHYQRTPPLPYINEFDPRHSHYIPPPHWPLDVGPAEAVDDEPARDLDSAALEETYHEAPAEGVQPPPESVRPRRGRPPSSR
jgi:hypothetical protein